MKRASFSVLFRGSLTGTVWFDDVALQEMEFGGCSVFEGKPMALKADAQAVPPAAAVRLSTGDGLALGFGPQGQVAELAADGRSILGTAPGGFWLRDAAAPRGRGAARSGKSTRMAGAWSSKATRPSADCG